MTPEHDLDRRFYRATGGLDLSVALGEPKATEESLIRLVAGACSGRFLVPAFRSVSPSWWGR